MKQREILDMWDMCRYEQYKYSDTGDTKTSPICAIFNENDMEELEKMEKKEYNLNSEIKHVTDSFLKLMREDLKNDLPSVTAFFSGPSVFQLLLKKMNIETINEMSIASNLVIAKYK